MKKITIFLLGIALIAAAKIVHGQSPKVKARQTYNWNHPSFSKGDTVINITNHYIFKRLAVHYIFIVDAIVFRGNKKNPFYNCHFVDGTHPNILVPENSIRKVHLYWVENIGPYIKEL